jgi:hypothetical protein
MDDRRISKRKIKKPSYLENFHTEDSKDVKPADANTKGFESLHKLIKEKRNIKIKPRSSIKTIKSTKKQQEANKRVKRKDSLISNVSKGKPVSILSIESIILMLNDEFIKHEEITDSCFLLSPSINYIIVNLLSNSPFIALL